jgi:hypothetical protein
MSFFLKNLAAMALLHTKLKVFLEHLISGFDVDLLTWGGFGLLGYVSNTLYIHRISIPAYAIEQQ